MNPQVVEANLGGPHLCLCYTINIHNFLSNYLDKIYENVYHKCYELFLTGCHLYIIDTRRYDLPEIS